MKKLKYTLKNIEYLYKMYNEGKIDKEERDMFISEALEILVKTNIEEN